MLKIERKKALALCIALDFKSAKKWDNDRMSKKLRKLSTLIDDDTTTDSNELDLLLDSVIEAGKNVKVVEDGAATEEPEKETKKTKKKKGKKKAKKDNC